MSERKAKNLLQSSLYLGVIMFVLFPVLGVMYSVGIFLAIFIEQYNESNSKAGWIGSTMFFSLCISYPLAVFLRRRLGMQVFILCTSCLVVLSFLSTPFMPSLNYLFITYSIPFGMACGAIDCLTLVTLPEYFDRYLGLAMGFRCASIASGAMLFNFVIPIIIDAVGWKVTMYSLSSLGIAFVPFALVYHSPKLQEQAPDMLGNEHNSEAAIKMSRKMKATFEFLRNKEFLSLLIGNLLFLTVSVVPPIFMIQYTKNLGYPFSESKWLVIIYNLSSLVGRIVIGRIGDLAMRYRKVKYGLPMIILAFGISSGLCSQTQSLPLLTLYMGVIGGVDGIFWVIILLAVIEVTSSEQAGNAYSLLVFVTSFGYLSGPPAMGLLYDVTGDFRNVLYVVCVFAITAAVVMVIGPCMTSREGDRSAHGKKKETTEGSTLARADYFGLSRMSFVSILEQKQIIVEKVSVV